MGTELQLLTNSKRSCFLECPRKFFLKYELRRVPLKAADALAFGSLVHRALEAFWKRETVDMFCVFQDVLTSKTLDRDIDAYAVRKALEMFRGYCYIYEEFDHDRYRTLAVEAEYRAPLINPKTGKASRTWLLAGKIDAIVQDDSGRGIIVEHKTTSKPITPESDYWRKLTIDGQISGYLVGAAALGYDTTYCLYDVLAKPQLKPYKATPPDEIKYKKDGTPYANTRMADETPEEYGQRIYEAIKENPDRYYARRDVVRMEDEITAYMADMWAIGLMIRACQLDKTWPHNGNACTEFGGCEYFDVCAKMASIDDDTRFMTVKDAPELGGVV